MKIKTILVIALCIVAVIIAVIAWHKNPIGYYKKQIKALEQNEINYKKTLENLERERQLDSLRYAEQLEAFRFIVDSLNGALEIASKKIQYHENNLLNYGNTTTDERFGIFTDHITGKDSVPR